MSIWNRAVRHIIHRYLEDGIAPKARQGKANTQAEAMAEKAKRKTGKVSKSASKQPKRTPVTERTSVDSTVQYKKNFRGNGHVFADGTPRKKYREGFNGNQHVDKFGRPRK